MKLQYVASACVVVEYAGVRVLCDPWLIDGAYGGAWYHNPPLKVTPEDFHDVHYIFVSHIHPDHFCPRTFERLSRDSIVLIGSYAEAFLGKQIRAMGFTVLELPHDEPVSIGTDFTIQIIPADDCNPEACGRWIGCQIKEPKERASYQIDTLAVFRGGESVIVNANDCPYELAKGALNRIVRDYGSPDLLCVGYAGAGPWPQCFDSLTLEQKRVEAQRKRESMLGQARQFINHLNPKVYLPFAGQYTLGGSLVDLNDLRGVPELDELDQWGDARMVRLNRMAWWDCETEQASEEYRRADKVQRATYRELLRSKTLDHEADEWPEVEEIASLVEAAREALYRRCASRGFTSPWRIGLDVEGNGWRYSTYLTFQRHIMAGPELILSLDARLLRRIVTRRFNFNNAEVGSLMTFDRGGHAYDRGSLYALSWFHV